MDLPGFAAAGPAEALARALTGDNARHVVSLPDRGRPLPGPRPLDGDLRPRLDRPGAPARRVHHRGPARRRQRLRPPPDRPPRRLKEAPMPVVNRIADLAPTVAEWRRDIHAHPEVLFDTHRTSGARRRQAPRLRLRRGRHRPRPHRRRRGDPRPRHRLRPGRRAARRHGRAADDRGDRPRRTPRPSPARCTPAATTATPRCCSAPRSTSPRPGNFDGTAVVIFQPAEEGGGGGREMVEDGLMERFGIEEVYGLHNMPGLAGRRLRGPPRPDARRLRHVHHRGDRPRRPRRPAAQHHRPGGRRERRSCWRCSRSSPATSTR